MKIILLSSVIILLSSLSLDSIAQTTPGEPSAKQVKKWFKKKEWLGGLHLQPHQTVDKIEFAKQYHANKAYWDKAFEFLKQDLQALSVGRHVVDGDNVFAIVTENPTKDVDSTMWESHHNYIDLHYVISGKEKISVYPAARLTVSKPYDASKDVVNYSGTGETYDALPGTFFIFFPSDAHRPNITPGGNKPDKKIVIKIRYAQ